MEEGFAGLTSAFYGFFEPEGVGVTVFRLLLAVLLGGAIGIERGVRNHPAGFRTHSLVCVGACLAMLTNQYVFENISGLSDPTRLGAQVITGVGFLGVGTILVTGRHRIKGLTTAAGLWASACTGLAIGIGFYSGAIAAAVIIVVVLALFPAIERRIYARSRTLQLYIEIDSVQRMKPILAFVRDCGADVTDMHYGSSALLSNAVGLHLSLRLPKRIPPSDMLELIGGQEGVALIEEI
ncbi:MAG: MgtC/SapB family protein [Clostridiales Family XIII bacterium]|jgi:putative Mg2+ transporter-C (MgtC) family protein|nr:MgtC/SapB family protein [Clostridiales Family XIII bacterium]